MEQAPKNVLETLFQQIQLSDLFKIIGRLFPAGIVFYLKPNLFLNDPLIWASICVGYMFLNYSIASFYSSLLIHVYRLELSFQSVFSIGFFFLLAGAPFLVVFLLREMHLSQNSTRVVVFFATFYIILFVLVLLYFRNKLKKQDLNKQIHGQLNLNLEGVKLQEKKEQ